jgi:hypothetical protein
VTGKIYKSKTPEDQKARIKIIKQMKNQRQRYLTEESFRPRKHREARRSKRGMSKRRRRCHTRRQGG